MKLIYLKSALKFDSFDVAIGIKIPFFRVSVTIEPGLSFTTVRYHELFDSVARFRNLNYLSQVPQGSSSQIFVPTQSQSFAIHITVS